MKVTYSIEREDFLVRQLFLASTSALIKRKRLRDRLIPAAVYMLIGLSFICFQHYFFGTLFLIVALLWFLIYPLSQRKRLLRIYGEHLNESLGTRADVKVFLELTNEFILLKNDVEESRIATSEIRSIQEIPSLILVRFDGSAMLIIPKRKVAELNELVSRLKELANHLNVGYVTDLDWKWR